MRVLPILLVAFAACGGEPDPANGNGLVQGAWDGDKIHFVVEGATVREVIAHELSCGAAKPECPAYVDLPIGDLVIDGSGRFARTGPGLSVQGAFSDPTTAIGTFDFQPPDGCCHVVIPWSAEAVSPEPVDCTTIETQSGADDEAALVNGVGGPPLKDGDGVDIAFGTQGAYMVVLGVDARGFDPTRVEVDVKALDGETVLAKTHLKRPGWVEQPSGGLRVDKVYVVSDLDVSALKNKTAVLKLHLANPCGFVLERKVTVTLTWQAAPH